MTTSDVNPNKSNAFIVGYGGWVMIGTHSNAYVDYGNQGFGYITPDPVRHKMLQVTSASVTMQRNIPSANSYYLPLDGVINDGTSAKAPILLGEGTYSFSGEISFELTYGVMGKLFNNSFLNRKTWFDLIMFDGKRQCSIANCVWSSFGIQCSPNSLVTVSLSFQSNNSYLNELQVRGSSDVEFLYDKEDLLIPYWSCGHNLFQDFSVTFDRNVTPIFLNGNNKTAAYLRAGVVNVSVNATTIDYHLPDEFKGGSVINLEFGGSKTLKLIHPQVQSHGYNMPSMNDVGTTSYSWTSIGEKSSEQVYSFSS